MGGLQPHEVPTAEDASRISGNDASASHEADVDCARPGRKERQQAAREAPLAAEADRRDPELRASAWGPLEFDVEGVGEDVSPVMPVEPVTFGPVPVPVPVPGSGVGLR
jgi:hypothetical protein